MRQIHPYLFLLLSLTVIYCTPKNTTGSLHRQQLLNVKTMGAKGDGKTYDSPIIQAAIDSIHAMGGGTVYVPPGDYLIKPLTLKSNLTLHLEKGACLVASDKFEDYPYVETRWEGTVCQGFQPILYAHSAKNISVVGGGSINGQGKAWWDEFWRLLKIYRKDPEAYKPDNKWVKEMAELNKDCPPLNDRPQWDMQWLRPVTIQFFKCKDVKVEGITIHDAPFWTIHPTFTDNAHFEHLTINNPIGSPNTDGIDPESCDGVVIANCNFVNGDDCIAIKSGVDIDGRNYNVPSKNITINNCVFSSEHSALAIGSEMSGGIENVMVSNCVFPLASNGIVIKSKRSRGGYVRNLRFSNIIMGKISKVGVKVNMYYAGGGTAQNENLEVNEGTPFMSHMSFQGIQIDSCHMPFEIAGLPEAPIHDIRFSSIYARHADKLPAFLHEYDNYIDDIHINGKPYSRP